MIVWHRTRSSLHHSLPAATTLLQFSSFHHNFSLTDLCGSKELSGLVKTEQHFLSLPASSDFWALCISFTTFTSSKGCLLILHVLFKKWTFKWRWQLWAYICLCEKNNIYPTLLCEGLVCMKVAAKKPSNFSCTATELLNTDIYILLVCYVWPSVCGWNTVGIFHFLKKLTKIIYLNSFFIFFPLISTLCSFHPVGEMLHNDNPRHSYYPWWRISCVFL